MAKTNPPIKLGIVGCGAVTAQCHVPAILSLTKRNLLNITVCIDRNIEQAKKIAGKLKCKQVDAEINSFHGAVDALLIATPPHTHFLLTLEAAKFARILFVEKPFLNTGEEFQKIKSAAKDNSTVISVGHMRRLYPSLNMAKDFIQSGILGKPIEAQVFDGNVFRWDTASDYLIGAAGGVILDTGSHALDSMLYILQMDQVPDDQLKFDSINSMADSETNEAGAWGNFIVSTRDSNLKVTYGFDRIIPLANLIRIFCEKGTVEVNTLFSDYFTVLQNGKRFNIFSSENIYPINVDECFEKQLQEMGNSESPQHYSRFYHTTLLLESLNNLRKIQTPPWRTGYV